MNLGHPFSASSKVRLTHLLRAALRCSSLICRSGVLLVLVRGGQWGARPVRHSAPGTRRADHLQRLAALPLVAELGAPFRVGEWTTIWIANDWFWSSSRVRLYLFIYHFFILFYLIARSGPRIVKISEQFNRISFGVSTEVSLLAWFILFSLRRYWQLSIWNRGRKVLNGPWKLCRLEWFECAWIEFRHASSFWLTRAGAVSTEQLSISHGIQCDCLVLLHLTP